MMFLSCFKWNADDEEWQETGASVNLDQVHWFGVISQRGETWGIQVDFGGGEYPNSFTVVSDALTRDMACGFFSALLSSMGIPHWPPLPAADIEVARKPGGLKPPPGSEN